MIVADRPSCRLPDMFLRVEIRRGDGKRQDFEARMLRQEGPDKRPPMPCGAVPQQQDWMIGVGLEKLLEMLDRRRAVHDCTLSGQDLAGAEVQRAIEARLLAAGVQSHDGGLAFGCPHSGGRGLQVETGFVLRQNNCLRR